MKPISILNKLNESVNINRKDVEAVKKYIKQQEEEYGTRSQLKQDRIYDEIRYRFGLRRVSSKLSKEDIQAYLGLLKELKDYSKSIGSNNGVKAVERVIKIKFGGEKFEDKEKLRSKTYYALFSDGGNPYAALNSKQSFIDSKNWYIAKSEDQTKEEFRKYVRSMAIRRAEQNYNEYSPSDIDVMVFDNFEKFKAACAEHNIEPEE